MLLRTPNLSQGGGQRALMPIVNALPRSRGNISDQAAGFLGSGVLRLQGAVAVGGRDSPHRRMARPSISADRARRHVGPDGARPWTIASLAPWAGSRGRFIQINSGKSGTDPSKIHLFGTPRLDWTGPSRVPSAGQFSAPTRPDACGIKGMPLSDRIPLLHQVG